MKTKRKFRVKFRASQSDVALAGLFDMLRYERAVVVGWHHDPGNGPGGWELELEADNFTPDRWQSFGLYPAEVL